jgi:hypothetical protein
MKFVTITFAIAALLSTVTAQRNAFEDQEQPKGTTYESLEKERFVYGRPGEEGYGEPKTADEIMELEQMWVVDLEAQKWRGFAQGYHRGLYKDYDWLMPAACISKDTVKQMYYI